MARRRTDLGSFFTFGGRVPTTVGVLLALLVLGTVWGALDRRIPDAAALGPESIVRGEVWRLVTWPFVETNVLGLLFGGYMLFWLGQQLSYAWSERRFLSRFLVYTLGAGLGTTLLSRVWEDASVPHLGVWPVVVGLLVAWAMLFPDRQMNWFGILPMTGKTVAWITVGLTVLSGLFAGGARGLARVLPHLIAIGIAWMQARGFGGRRFGRQARQWWADREMRRRSKHLKVVRKNGSGDRSKWMN
ncbi:MAG TPA: rhomboid family intramembrane serine protease [Anaeromyxobacter sp.]